MAAVLSSSGRARWAAFAAAAALFLAGGLGFLVPWTAPAGAPVSIGLLQGNVAQEIKWREDVRAETLAGYHRMITETDARIVIIPETALPAFLDELPKDYVASLVEHGREKNKEILLGTVERDHHGAGFLYYNSVVRLAPGADALATASATSCPSASSSRRGSASCWRCSRSRCRISPRAPAAQPPLVAAGIPFGVAICYEDIFGEEVIDFLPQAQILLNVSNDAWFGRSFAADQHMQSSQMRALETGRWMVRSTNTGASAAIDERGRVVSRPARVHRGRAGREGDAPAGVDAVLALGQRAGAPPRGRAAADPRDAAPSPIIGASLRADRPRCRPFSNSS